jgi:aspartate carbamoyltransferase catalytic subunit
MSPAFPHHHLLDIERLSAGEIEFLLERAEHFDRQNKSGKRKTAQLTGKTVVTLFFEPSTRTRISFEIAAQRLGADVINFSTETASTKKGETLLDTIQAIDDMRVDALVIRHAEDGIPHFLAPQVRASVINAGDGKNEHPTQALLDALVIRRHKKTLKGLTIAYCGDFVRSRVAKSFIQLMSKFGSRVRVIAPPNFMTQEFERLGVQTFDDMAEGLRGADVVMAQRIQLERMREGEFAMSFKDYHQRYGLDHKKLAAAKPDVIVMHPGPINRDVEISGALADDPKFSVIREQIATGVAVRMAVLDTLLNSD